MIETYNKRLAAGEFDGIERDDRIRGGINHKLLEAIRNYKMMHTFRVVRTLIRAKTGKI